MKFEIITCIIVSIATISLVIGDIQRNHAVKKVFEYFDRLGEIYNVELGSKSYVSVDRGVTFPPGKEPGPISCTHTVFNQHQEL